MVPETPDKTKNDNEKKSGQSLISEPMYKDTEATCLNVAAEEVIPQSNPPCGKAWLSKKIIPCKPTHEIEANKATTYAKRKSPDGWDGEDDLVDDQTLSDHLDEVDKMEQRGPNLLFKYLYFLYGTGLLYPLRVPPKSKFFLSV